MNLATPSPSPAGPQLKDIVPPQAYHLPGDYIWLAIAIAAAAAAGYIAWRYWRRPRKPGPALTPRELAEKRLGELRARAAELAPREFGAEVCGIITAYIGAVYGMHPEHQTSPEFLAAMAEHRIFSPAQHSALAEFLAQCDLLKFARADAALAGKELLLEQAAEFIQAVGAAAAAPPISVPA